MQSDTAALSPLFAALERRCIQTRAPADLTDLG